MPSGWASCRGGCVGRALLAPVVLLAACGGGGGGGGAEFGLESRAQVTTLTFPTGQAPVGAVVLEPAFPSLNRDPATGTPPLFSSPIFLGFAPDGSDRIFIGEQAGRIRVFPNDPAVTRGQVATFLDIAARVNAGGEKGLLGFAFSPDFATTGELYVTYTAGSDSALQIRLSRFRVTGADPNQADPQSEEIILTAGKAGSNTNHNSGMVAFGPDGMLYVTIGDGGGADDPGNNGQNPGTLLGKLLRLDVRGQATYAIPADNPFVGVAGVRGEIYALGLRNPWRFSFDRLTGQLWLGDVGQNAREEIDLVTAGANLGWPRFEGTRLHRDGVALASAAPTASLPVAEYANPSLGRAVIGGYVYRGQAHPAFVGRYFYADNRSGRLFALLHDGNTVVFNEQVAGTGQNPSSFGEDAAGEVYLVGHGGDLFRLAPSASAPPGGSIPATLSATGIFRDLASLTPNPGIIEYDVNAELWSDGARKRRWIALPGVSRIVHAATDPWVFPVGTVLVKHFEIDLIAGDPLSARRLETRVLVHRTGGWEGYTYRWNAQQTDADLLTTGDDETLTVTDPLAPGGQRQQVWRYPSSQQCLECHTEAAGRILGVHTRQLNRTFDYPERPDNQLRAWAHIGLFTEAIGDPASLPRHPEPFDPAAPLAERARAYLDANCAQCHRAGGPTQVDLDLRSTVAEVDLRAIGVAAVNGLGLPDGLRIKAGVASESVLQSRLERVDGLRMPPLGSHVRDPAGSDLVRAWIDSLP